MRGKIAMAIVITTVVRAEATAGVIEGTKAEVAGTRSKEMEMEMEMTRITRTRKLRKRQLNWKSYLLNCLPNGDYRAWTTMSRRLIFRGSQIVPN
jgi:hypothetical protein